jgi:hypothetical protein
VGTCGGGSGGGIVASRPPRNPPYSRSTLISYSIIPLIHCNTTEVLFPPVTDICTSITIKEKDFDRRIGTHDTIVKFL